MANNEKNLRPFTKEQAREYGRKGGLKAAETKRKRKNAKECMNMILALDAKGKKSRELMTNMGIEDKEQQNIMLLMATMFAKAASTGDPSAIKTILEIAGDLTPEQVKETKPEININIAAATKADADGD